MAKFENSTYARIWDSNEGRNIVNAILQDPNLLKQNHTFWATKFKVDPQITPTDAKGRATFISTMRKLENGLVMDMRAPLGDSLQAEEGNLAYYTGVIPDFIARGYVEKATERYYKEQLFDQFGDARLVATYATEVLQRQLDAANQTLSNMSAQLLSTGEIIYGIGEGIQGKVLKADVPTENFIGAGAAVWSDPNARLLDQIVKIVNDVNDHLGRNDIAWQLEIEDSMWKNNFLNNAQVKEWIRYYYSLNNVVFPSEFVATTEMANKAISAFEGLPQIVVVKEGQNDVTGVVHGWAANKAVLRPVGYAGYVRHTNILDEVMYKNYGAGAIKRNFSYALNGLALVMNTTLDNGNLKEWHTDTMMSAVPSLDEFLYHYIIDTTTVSANTFNA